MVYNSNMNTSLPDPEYDVEFYEDVLSKRLIAWVIDVVLISMIVGLIVLTSLFIALIFLPFIYLCTSFTYRWATLASGSATLGMRFMAIEVRDRDGGRLDGTTAFLHTAGYAFSVVTFPLQLISIVMMLNSSQKQGLTDSFLGTSVINRSTT